MSYSSLPYFQGIDYSLKEGELTRKRKPLSNSWLPSFSTSLNSCLDNILQGWVSQMHSHHKRIQVCNEVTGYTDRSTTTDSSGKWQDWNHWNIEVLNAQMRCFHSISTRAKLEIPMIINYLHHWLTSGGLSACMLPAEPARRRIWSFLFTAH